MKKNVIAMFKNYHLTKKMWGFLVLMFINISLFSQSKLDNSKNSGFQVSGKVTNVNNAPLDGVTVLVDSASSGVITDKDGGFSITVPSATSKLTFSFVGYISKEVLVNGQTNINVTLLESSNDMNDVIVIGYGKKKQKDVTGAVGVVNMNSVKEFTVTSADQALVAQVPGVQVNATNGIPGGGAQVIVRNVGNIGADNTPLYVVDGFALPNNNGQGARQQDNPLTSIPPEDIASMTVLKDASATAIYGSRGANGVIIITTKSGQTGAMRVGVNLYNAWQAVPGYAKLKMMNAEQFAQFQKDIIDDNNAVNNTNTPVPDIYQDPSQFRGKGTNWLNAVTRTAPIENFNFNLSGGSKNFNTYMAGGYLRQLGTVLGTDFNRIYLRVNINGEFAKKWHVGFNISPSYEFGNNVSNGGNDRGDAFGFWEVANPIASIYNSNGTYNPMTGTEGTFNVPNPVMALKETKSKHTSTDILSSAYISYDILPDLTIKSILNGNIHNEDQNNFNPSTLGGFNSPPPSLASGYYGFTKFYNWANENSLSYAHKFKGGHSLSVLGDFSVQQEIYNTGAFTGTQYPDDIVQTLNAAALITGATNKTAWGLVSYLGRLDYSYQDKYLFTATARRDGSSKFGPNNRWGTFPSVALGWVVSNEPWMKNISSVINSLKLRASYGIAGNDAIGNSSYLGQIGTANYILGGAISGGTILNSMINSNLAWEKTKEFNIGIDMQLFNSRLEFSSNVYKSKTDNLVQNVNIPPSSGFSTVTENTGAVQNTGLELNFDSKNIVSKNFTWQTNVNFTLSRNKALSLGPNVEYIQAGSNMEGHPTNITLIGRPVGLFFGYNVLGIYADQNDINNSPHIDGAIPGTLKVEDANKDGSISPVSDFTTIGNPYPKFQYGITNSMTYKNISLSFVLSGSYGAQVYDASTGSYNNIDGIFNVAADVMNRWRSASQPGDGKHPTTAGPSLGRVMYRDVNSLNIYSASYLWIKNISLQYTFPKSFIKNIFTDFQVYGSVQNPYIFKSYYGNPTGTNYTGSNGYGSALTPGVAYNNYPIARVYTIGFRANF